MKFNNSDTAPVVPDVATYPLGTRVKLSGTFSDLDAPTVTAAGIEDDFGVLINTDPFGNTGNRQTVRLSNAQGTVPMIAAGAITAGAYVYPAAAGKISATVAGNAIGIALQSASGSGSLIEVYRFKSRKAQVVSMQLLAASVDSYIFIADRPMTVTGVNLLVAVAGSGGAATVAVRKITAAGTALPGAAAGATVKELLTAGVDLTSAAGTTVAGTLTATVADLDLAVGDKLAVDLTGTLTSLVALLTVEAQEK